MSKETKIEARLRVGIERLGGLCLKFPAIFFAGIPDRLCLLPGGRVFFVETKAPGLTLRPRQAFVKRQLEALGFNVYVVNSEELVDGLLASYGAAISGNAEGLTAEEKDELASLSYARFEIVTQDPTDDLNEEELARLFALQAKALK
jgi:hypothetical protein